MIIIRTSVNEQAKKLTVRDAAHFIVKSWSDASVAAIANWSKKAGFTEHDVENNSESECREDDQTPNGMTNTEFQA